MKIFSWILFFADKDIEVWQNSVTCTAGELNLKFSYFMFIVHSSRQIILN